MDDASNCLAVEFTNVKFAYGRGPAVIDIKSLQIPRGSRFFLHGPSGSGKTSFLGLVAGILVPSAGQVRTLGQDLMALPATSRDRFRGERCGYIFQMFNLLPYLNVRQNILLPSQLNKARMARLLEQGPIESSLSEMAERLDITNLLERRVAELSVGQQQRVAAARALLGSPELIIADEPTSALDQDRRQAFIELLFREADRTNTTILFVSHDQTLMPLFSDVMSLNEINAAASKRGG